MKFKSILLGYHVIIAYNNILKVTKSKHFFPVVMNST